MPRMTEGLFITFEGPDGGGKSTQVRRFIDRLRASGREVVENTEPGGTFIGQQIREILLDGKNHAMSPRAELLLYFASRAQAVDERVRPALARGAIVVSDRFTDSSLVYQGVARGLGVEAVRRVHDVACAGLWPHVTFLLDIDPEVGQARAAERGGVDRLEAAGRDFHERVRAAYLEIARTEPGRVKLIDGAQPVEAVAAEIWAHYEGRRT